MEGSVWADITAILLMFAVVALALLRCEFLPKEEVEEPEERGWVRIETLPKEDSSQRNGKGRRMR